MCGVCGRERWSGTVVERAVHTADRRVLLARASGVSVHDSDHNSVQALQK